ncbi:IclR family transcriptional regulator [Rathayibacter soli]|uniref:IclR family transcriptional regulator n=1 Tax=Rathayibacter soli TaxID=3144168 RepID=UPI0027E3F195|nr:helix-turn-helix domain-containing protein [Glaciibacter superstes]
MSKLNDERELVAEAATRTVERALSLLAIICDEGRINLADSSRAAGLSPSTTLRLLRTLESGGFVRRDDAGDYRPGSRMIQLGAQSLSNESLISLARETMEMLCTDTGESVYLSIEGHNKTSIYIATVEGTHSVRHTNWVGRTIPISGSAAGAVLRDEIPAAGYVIVEHGVEDDITAIAAAIRSEHKVVAALSLVIPSYRLTQLDTARYSRLLIEGADHVSALLGGKTNPATTEKTVL